MIHILLAALISVPENGAGAKSFPLASADDSVIGRIRTVFPEPEDTLLDVARRNGLGYGEIKLVNPVLDTWKPESGEEILLPTEFVLPAAPRTGIVLNIPEMRLYFFRKPTAPGEREVMTFPIGIGREGWSTPYVRTKVAQKQEKPSWYPPESIRREHAEKGDPLPKRVGPGPDNPLGEYAMRLGLPQYLIHGTNRPWGVGMRVSHGCIRLYPEDIEQLFRLVTLGTPVEIVNQPYKVGQRNGRMFLEAHPSLDEDAEHFNDDLTSVVKLIVQMTEDRSYDVDWDLAKQVIQQARGVPIEIGRIGATKVPVVAGTGFPARSRSEARGIELRLDSSLPALEH